MALRAPRAAPRRPAAARRLRRRAARPSRASASAAAAPTPPPRAGARVLVADLTKSAALNGREGTAGRAQADGSVLVTLDGESKPRAFTAKNLCQAPAPLIARCAAEAFGAAVIVGGGCGAVALGAPQWGVAAAFGLSVWLGVLLTKGASGAHLNPAVTAMMLWLGDIRLAASAAYIAAQCAGATAAAFVLKGAGATLPAAGVSAANATGIELWLTFALCAAVLRRRSLDSSRVGDACIAGGVVALEAYFFGPLTGASMNPARSLGPALVAGGEALQLLWVYVAGPALGAVLALMCKAAIEAKDR